ncbi:NHL repeat-containing protein [Aquimarina longa]|uniref:NHL repeat-containing protein n=1 Tax=Aquimarina longa TaxID=1080221 RepID=UPI000780C74E|nr:NHL repeat-containing protein [Aquimarina longa]
MRNYTIKIIKLLLLSIAILALSCSKDDDATTPTPTNKAPKIEAQSFNASESATDADIFGTVKATDADKDELSYSITANSDNLFEITKTGALSLAAGKTLDFETKTTHEITVEVTDGKSKAAAKITITVIDVDENMPPVIADQTFSVAENSPLGTVIGTVIATDPDGDNLTYTVANSTGALAEFEMTGNEIKLKSGFLDYEVLTSHTVTVTVNDGTLTASAQITINVSDVNEAPTIPDQNYTFSQPEDIDDTVIIGTVAATDPDGDTLMYTLNNNPGNLFEINSSGEISLATGKMLDYETQTSHTVTVQVTDGDLIVLQHGVKINVTDVVETTSGITVSTFVGSPSKNVLFSPRDLIIDASGNFYVADKNRNHIRKMIQGTGSVVVSTFAGSGQYGTVDAMGTAARFGNPSGIVKDASGNFYVCDQGTAVIRKITPAGDVTTFAGSPNNRGLVNGTGSAARFASPTGIVIDASGNLYVADGNNHAIRKITPAGVVTTFAGGNGAGSMNGGANFAEFTIPKDLIIDASGNFYVTDGNHRIRKITPSGQVSTLAGSSRGYADGTGSAAKFNNLTGITIDTSGNLYVSETYTIRKITPAGEVTTVAGQSGNAGNQNGDGTVAKFNELGGITIDASGNLYVGDIKNKSIRKITFQQTS